MPCVYATFLPCLRDGVERRPLSILIQLTDSACTVDWCSLRCASINLLRGRQRWCSTSSRHISTERAGRWRRRTTLRRYEQSHVDGQHRSPDAATIVRGKTRTRHNVASIIISSSSSFGGTFPGTQRRLDRVFDDDVDDVWGRSVAVHYDDIRRNCLP